LLNRFAKGIIHYNFYEGISPDFDEVIYDLLTPTAPLLPLWGERTLILNKMLNVVPLAV
jgi:hypothetical protein